MNKLYENNICALCNKTNSLQQSHIIPKFIGRWIKETGSGYMVRADNPSERVQDTLKTELLCSNCEEKFSKFEGSFAKTIFFPFHDKNFTTFDYDENLGLFILSLSWRIIKIQGDCFKHDYPYFKSLIDESETNWRKLLLDDKQIIHPYENHLFFLDHLKDGPKKRIKLNWYISHAIDLGIVPNIKDKKIWFYAKFPDIMCASLINLGTLNDSYVTKIEKTGKITTSQSIEDQNLKQFILERSDMLTKSPNWSAEEQKIKTNHIRKNPQKILESNILPTIIEEINCRRKEKMKDMPKCVIGLVDAITKNVNSSHLGKTENMLNQMAIREITDIISDLSKENANQLHNNITLSISTSKMNHEDNKFVFKTSTLWIVFMTHIAKTQECQRARMNEELNKLTKQPQTRPVPIMICSLNVESDGVSCEFMFKLCDTQ